MREVDYQTQIVNAVREDGGFARKLAHRSLVGVVDLFVKLIDDDPCFIEVKKAARPAKAETVRLEVTVPQQRFLLEASHAGVNGYVLSLLTAPNKLWGATFEIQRLTAGRIIGSSDPFIYVLVSEHRLLSNRHEAIRDLIRGRI